MKSLRMALLAAAALAVVPGAAWAERQNQPDNHADRGDRGGDRGDRGGRGGGDFARPTPPQGHGSGMMVMPGSTPNGFRPSPQAVPQAQPQFQQPNRGNWQGNWRGPGAQGRGDVRPNPVPQADTGQARAQWRQENRGGNEHRDGDRRWGNDNRGQWNGGDRRPDNDNHRWDNRGQWNNGDHSWNGNDRGQWNNRGDHRWDNGRGQWNNGDHSWNGRHGDGHRWDASRWRNDRRYDWRDWRGSHRNLFSRHYYAPRGYHYRSVYAGFFLEPLFYGSNYWLDNPYDYRLPPVEWPLQWVHYYNDALLVDVTTGEVVDVIPNFFF